VSGLSNLVVMLHDCAGINEGELSNISQSPHNGPGHHDSSIRYRCTWRKDSGWMSDDGKRESHCKQTLAYFLAPEICSDCHHCRGYTLPQKSRQQFIPA
jgi:hypothetical protein